MPRRKPPRRQPNRHQQHATASPQNSRRGKAQRHILLGGDFNYDFYDHPAQSRGRHSLTLAEEARNTEERSYRRSDDKKLRQLGISFVRSQEPQDLETLDSKPQLSDSSSTQNDPQTAPPQDLPEAVEPAAAGRSQSNSSTEQLTGTQSQDNSNLESTSATPAHESSGDLSSAGEEIVFVPRNQRRDQTKQSQPQNSDRLSPTVQSSAVLSNGPAGRTLAPKPVDPNLPKATPSQPEPVTKTQRKRKPFKKSKHRDMMDEEEDEIYKDYIQNLQENCSDVGEETFSLRLLGNQLDDIESDSGPATRNGNEPQEDEGSSDNSVPQDEDLEIEVDLHIAAVIGKRHGEFGVEYCFKPSGTLPEEAIWLESSDMTHDIQYLIDHFEASVEGTVRSRWNDDEALAMLLQQSSNVGEEDEEDEDDDDDDDDDDDFDAEDLINMVMGKPNKRGTFPNASKLADAYDDFDVMDRSRASLAGPLKRKSRKAAAKQASNASPGDGMGAEDAELMAKLENYIAQDRERKRIRKQAKESLRQGMFEQANSKPGSMDFRSTLNGLTPGQMTTTTIIKQFLMSGRSERLSLPAMSKQERSQIHTVAHKFFMTSKSQGKGNNRFPVLYKTKRTAYFEGDEEAIDKILGGISRRYIRGGRGNFKGGRGQAHDGGGDNIRNKDGMIVGTGAAEIGQGNKGYEMLAKMGWTMGTGLGSNRSGILDPVQAIVKNSRTGLG